jgi:hypothetical protein
MVDGYYDLTRLTATDPRNIDWSSNKGLALQRLPKNAICEGSAQIYEGFWSRKTTIL